MDMAASLQKMINKTIRTKSIQRELKEGKNIILPISFFGDPSLLDQEELKVKSTQE